MSKPSGALADGLEKLLTSILIERSYLKLVYGNLELRFSTTGPDEVFIGDWISWLEYEVEVNKLLLSGMIYE